MDGGHNLINGHAGSFLNFEVRHGTRTCFFTTSDVNLETLVSDLESTMYQSAKTCLDLLCHIP